MIYHCKCLDKLKELIYIYFKEAKGLKSLCDYNNETYSSGKKAISFDHFHNLYNNKVQQLQYSKYIF